MQELYSRALVLDRRENNELDALLDVFTQEYGKVRVRAKGMRKITSKLSAHFQPLSFVKMRFIARQNGTETFVLLDGVDDEMFARHRTRERYDLLPIITFLNAHAFVLEKDERLWHVLTKVFSARYAVHDVARVVLSLLGFDSRQAACAVCKKTGELAFHTRQEEFFCPACSSKFTKNELLYLYHPHNGS